MSATDEMPSIGTMLERSKMLASIAPMGFSTTDANMVVDIAIKATDDANRAFSNALELLPVGAVRMQTGMLGLQLLEMACQMQREGMVEIIQAVGGVIMEQGADGTVRERPGPNVGKRDFDGKLH